ncbi:RmlC-like cupin domain-containing protein [Geopyxis carbonaria]|nr:RmlC-like cupin domain-containing protein [Geopyxis carbonaria]
MLPTVSKNPMLYLELVPKPVHHRSYLPLIQAIMPVSVPLPSLNDFAGMNSCMLPVGTTCKKHNRPLTNSFDGLVEEIKTILGPFSGIDSSDVDVNILMEVMSRYTSNEREWSGFAFKDLSRNYTRNFVDHGNGNANLLLLVWSPGKGSLIHDHAGAHCIMKILKGSLKETQYEMPTSAAGPLTITKSTVYGHDEVTYISDDIGLHKIENADKDEVAVSLHLYTPPWAEKKGCYCFEEKTGKKTKVEMCNYYSVHGKVKTLKPQICQGTK